MSGEQEDIRMVLEALKVGILARANFFICGVAAASFAFWLATGVGKFFLPTPNSGTFLTVSVVAGSIWAISHAVWVRPQVAEAENALDRLRGEV